MRDPQAIFLSLVLEVNDDGYLASVPDMQGAFAEGDTVEEAIFNCIDVVKMIAAYRDERLSHHRSRIMKRSEYEISSHHQTK